jgi:uncharacterized cupredoxin-like copper-binding protein
MPHRRVKAALAVLAVLTFPIAGCGGDESSEESSPEPASTAAGGGSSTEVTGGRTTVSMTEFAFEPDELSTKAGTLTVTAKNDGSAPHEFVLIRTKKAADALPVKGSEASDAGAVGEIPQQEPGASASHKFKVKSGPYVFICNVPGHYKAGMFGTLTVK